VVLTELEARGCCGEGGVGEPARTMRFWELNGTWSIVIDDRSDTAKTSGGDQAFHMNRAIIDLFKRSTDIARGG